MKKIVIACLLGFLLTLVLSTTALADPTLPPNPPPPVVNSTLGG
jgi:hypothetical protein